jgi:hypothetical protein
MLSIAAVILILLLGLGVGGDNVTISSFQPYVFNPSGLW